MKAPERFLTEVSGCGVGPGYGLTTLAGNDHPGSAHAAESIVFDGNTEVAAWPAALDEHADPWGGTIEIAHHGCADFTRLVLTGRERGRVFVENLDADYYSFTADGFLDWQETWFDATADVEGPDSRTAHPGDEDELITAVISGVDRARRFRAAWTLAARPEISCAGRNTLDTAAREAADAAVRALTRALASSIAPEARSLS